MNKPSDEQMSALLGCYDISGYPIKEAFNAVKLFPGLILHIFNYLSPAALAADRRGRDDSKVPRYSLSPGGAVYKTSWRKGRHGAHIKWVEVIQ